ncbi:MAG TPA: biotin/lipoyl-containing protein, partial [Candidatus Gracilibacteria bacterium]|nr:biotin/lipoyl-containing protein [Candidatus Gracilibacteria bacterium]
MAYEFKFPDVGEGIHEGKIVRWLVKEGDTVKADQSIAEVETDKAVVEIPSPKSGKILKITHKEGDVIKVGEILATIDDGGASEPAPKAAPAEEKRESTGVVGSLEPTAAGVMKAPSISSSGAVFGGGSGADLMKKPQYKGAVPPPTIVPGPTMEALAKKMEEEDKNKTFIPAPASGGLNVVKAGIKAVKKYDMFGYVDRAPYDSVRKVVGDHMVKSMFTIPHVTHTDMADVTALWKIREKEKVKAEKNGIKLTFMPFFMKAIIAGLIKHPYLNATLDEAA